MTKQVFDNSMVAHVWAQQTQKRGGVDVNADDKSHFLAKAILVLRDRPRAEPPLGTAELVGITLPLGTLEEWRAYGRFLTRCAPHLRPMAVQNGEVTSDGRRRWRWRGQKP